MVVKSFYLLGKAPDAATNIHKVDIDITHDLEAAKSHVSDTFSIVDPNSVAFQTKEGLSLSDLDELLEVDDPIAVSVDGHAVREVPGPKGLPIVGTFYQINPDHIGNHQRLFDQLGPVIQHTDMGKTIYLTNDPAVCAHIFQETEFWSKKIEGSHPLVPGKDNTNGFFLCDTDTRSWRLAHKFLVPALSPKAVRKYTPMMQKTAEDTFNVFDQFSEDEEAFDIFQYMFKLTSQAVGKLTLNVDFDHFKSADAQMNPMVLELLSVLALIKKVSDGGPLYSHLPFGDPKKLRDVKRAFGDKCQTAIKAAQSRSTGDLPLNTAALEAESIADYAVRAVDEDGNKLPMDVMLEAVPIIIGAGFVTTATLLSWMLYCAARYSLQDKLLQELIDFDVNAETKWDYDTTNALPYLDKFLKEVQRLYDPAYQPARTALREQIIPGGYHIPKGAVIIGAIHAVHRNANVWDDPGKFDPDRWDTEKVRKRPNAAYIPFAMGPRSCIGFNFALQEAKTVFITLLYRYEFMLHDGETYKYDTQATVFKPIDLYMRLKRRIRWPQKSQ